MSDTSGINALGAQSLQKEVEEQQESYQDSLIDQEIQKLSDDNEHAAEQRERQIAIMEAALEYDKESGALSRQAEQIVQNSLAQINGGTSPLGTLMGQLIAEEENWGSLTVAAYDVLVAEYIKAAVEAATGWTNINKKVDNTNETLGDLPGQEGIDNTTLNAATGGILSILEKEYGKYTAPEKNEKGEVTKEGGFSGEGNQNQRDSAITSAANSLKTYAGGLTEFKTTDYKKYKEQYDKYQAANGGSEAEFDEAIKREAGEAKDYQVMKTNAIITKKGNNWNWSDVKKGKAEEGSVSVNGVDMRLQTTKGEHGDTQLTTALSSLGVADQSIVYYKGKYYLWYDGYAALINSSKKDYSAFAAGVTLTPYETGGLADFTGPAWLDGTKSHPELVLNARDTQNFIQLKDILAEVMDSTNSISNKQSNGTNGDNYFNIDINVEELKDDYDVDQLADKIRRMLYDDASYRNVNAINLIR